MKNVEQRFDDVSLTRGKFLTLMAGGTVLAYNFIQHPEATLAQTEAPAASPQDPTRLLPLSGVGKLVAEINIGESTDKELLGLPNSRREFLPGGLTKYTFTSIIPERPHTVITGQDGVARFKQVSIVGTLGPGAYVDTPQFTSIYGSPESTAPPPKSDFWERPTIPLAETQIFASQGFALVALQSDRKVYEIQVFNPITVDQYLQTWAQIGKLQGQVAPDNPAPSALILLDGLGSSFKMDPIGLGPTFESLRQDLLPLYDLVARFSYSGGGVFQLFDRPPQWSLNLYGPKDTFQDVHKSADILRDMADGLRRYYKNIDLLGYSLGGFTAWQYLTENVMPERGPHRDSVIRSALLLDAPVNGVSGAEISNYLRGLGLDTQLGNDATTYLAALASSPQRQQATTGLNIKTAEILRDRRDVRLLCLTNGDDCFVKPKSAIIPGFGYALPLGRGANGIPNCDALLLAPSLPGNDSTNVGHTQILTDPRATSTIKYFLENQQGRQSVSPSPGIDQSPTPSTNLTDTGPQPGHSYSYSSEEDVRGRKEGETVAQLIKKLPYNEADFSVQYSFEENKFIVTLNGNNTTLANEELDKFLHENGVENRDWLYNLEVVK